MPTLIQKLHEKKLIHPPQWLPDSTQYLIKMGSVAYGCAKDDSDMDIYGWVIPRKELIFSHLTGCVPGFGHPPETFEQYQQHHIVDPDANAGKGQEYDLTIYSIVKYFQLCSENNPNVLDALYIPQHCILHCSSIGQMVRDNRKMFIHKGCFHKLRGYAFAQLHKMKNKEKESEKRQNDIDEYGYDLKFAYHVVRVVLQCEQLLTEGDLDLMRNAELLKSIRRGEWTEEQIREFFDGKEKHLNNLYETSTVLPHKPDMAKLKELLLNCLEHHYGTLAGAVERPSKLEDALRSIRQLIDQTGV